MNNFVVIEITPTYPSLHVLTSIKMIKTFAFYSLGCSIILYLEEGMEICYVSMCICARPYSLKTLNINWYHKSHSRLGCESFNSCWMHGIFFRARKNEKNLCKFMDCTWQDESKNFVWYLSNGMIVDVD